MPIESARAIADAVRSGETSAVDVCQAALARIAAANPALNAFHTVAGEQALAQAAALDGRRDEWARLPLLGVPSRPERQPLHARAEDHRRLADPRALHSPVHRDRGRTAGRRRRRHRREDELRRVRDGIVDRELRLRTDAQPVVARPDARRIERRIGGGRGGADGAARARLRHGRLHPPARGALRRRRPQANLRPRLALRPARLRVITRSDRTVRHVGGRRGAGAPGHRRPGSQGRHVFNGGRQATTWAR